MYKIGFEYELQLQLKMLSSWKKISGLSKKIQTVAIFLYKNGKGIIWDTHFYRINNIINFSENINIIFDKKNCYILPQLHIFNVKVEDIYTDLGNIEIRNNYPKFSIPEALKEVNDKLHDSLIPFLLETIGQYTQFSLHLPAFRYNINKLNDQGINAIGNAGMCSKHLNISIDSKLYPNIKTKRMYYKLSKKSWFVGLKTDGISNKDIKADKNYGSTNRIHLNLPYNFTNYNQIFKFKSILNDNWNEKSKPTLLGISRNHGLSWEKHGELV